MYNNIRAVAMAVVRSRAHVTSNVSVSVSHGLFLASGKAIGRLLC